MLPISLQMKKNLHLFSIKNSALKIRMGETNMVLENVL